MTVVKYSNVGEAKLVAAIDKELFMVDITVIVVGMNVDIAIVCTETTKVLRMNLLKGSRAR